MDTFGWIIMGLFVLVGVVGSAIYSGSETGLYTLSRVRLDVKAREGNRRARQIEKLIRRPGMMLAVLFGEQHLQLPRQLRNRWHARCGGIHPGESVLINAILVPLLFIFGEVLPKELFRENTDRWSYSAPLIEWTRRCLLDRSRRWSPRRAVVLASRRAPLQTANGGSSSRGRAGRRPQRIPDRHGRSGASAP